MKPSRAAHLAGSVLALAACLYVAVRLWGNPALSGIAGRPGAIATLALCAAHAFAANLCLALGWTMMIRRFDHGKLLTSRALAIYAWTQMGKYLPGNFMHFAGRYGLGRAAGISHPALGAATALEPLFLIFVAGIIALPFLTGWVFGHAGLAIAFIGAVVCLFIAAGFILARFETLRGGVVEALNLAGAFLRDKALGAILLYAAFFMLNGAIVVRILDFLGAGDAFALWPVISANAFAWVLGYVTVGAPAGIGVREIALIFALGSDPDGVVTASAGIYRIATLLGDFLFFLAGAAGMKVSGKSHV